LGAFRDGMRVKGLVDPEDVEINDRFLVDRYPLLPKAARRLIAENVDVIVTFGSTATAAASTATATIPIVALISGDPAAAGLADSLDGRGKNVTGLRFINGEVSVNRLELLKQVVPGLRVVGVPLNPESTGEVAGVKKAEPAARALDLDLHPIPVRQPDELEAALRAAAKQGIEAVAPVASTMFFANAEALVGAVGEVRLPAIYPSDLFARAGGLLSYGTNEAALFRHASILVGKILKGARASELPFERPTKFDLVVNVKTAHKLGLAIPRELLRRADQVIA
jgi:putative ABC transport system substrate-binding protein